MKAIIYKNYGGPEVLNYIEANKPIAQKDEVLIRVHASTVNRTDCGYLRGKPFIIRLFSGLLKPNYSILGNEFAGKIEAIGPEVKTLQVGDDVFGYSEPTFGGHAEYMVLSETKMIATMPDGFSYKQAAPSTEGGHYALTYLRRANVKAGQRILIYGATGAIGSAALQLAKYLGAHVTAVCDTKNINLISNLGPDKVIDYKTEDFTKVGETYDFVFDAVGKSSFGVCKKLLKPGGIYTSTELGAYIQNPLFAMWSYIFGGFSEKKRVIFPIPDEKKEDVEYIKQAMEAGKFKPVVDRTYPLQEVPEAFKYVETGQKVGNVVIRI